MEITLNNRIETFQPESMSIDEIMKVKNFSFPRVIVKVNGQLIKKPAYATTEIHDGDTVAIIHLISGG